MGFFSGVLDLLFPPKCVLCRRVLPAGKTGLCDRCAERVSVQDVQREGNAFSRCVIALPYEGQVREAVIRYKFQDQPGYAAAFGRILGETVQKRLKGEYDLITWVPVSRKRRKERGYDQAMLLAMETALRLDEVAVETLRKTVDNPKQSGLTDAEARKHNVQGVYQVVDPELITGKRILLIDDVVTTGATLEEASRTLKASGAESVLCAALASPDI